MTYVVVITASFCIVLLCICGCVFWLISESSSGLCTKGLEKEVIFIISYREVLRSWLGVFFFFKVTYEIVIYCSTSVTI